MKPKKMSRKEKQAVLDTLAEVAYIHKDVDADLTDIHTGVDDLRALVHAEGCAYLRECPNRHVNCKKGLSMVTAILWEVAGAAASFSLSARDVEVFLRGPEISMTLCYPRATRDVAINNFIQLFDSTFKANCDAAMQMLWLVRSALSLQQSTLADPKKPKSAKSRAELARIQEALDICNVIRDCFSRIKMYGRVAKVVLNRLTEMPK